MQGWSQRAWRALAMCALAAWFPAAVHAAGGEAERMTCRGTVADADGAPAAGARVAAYELVLIDGSVALVLHSQSTVDATGAFALSAPLAGAGRLALGVVAWSEDRAAAWTDWTYDKSNFTLKCGAPFSIAGKVIDEDGRPIAGADVRAVTVSGGPPRPFRIVPLPPLEILHAVTDADGAFAIGGLPAGSTANLLASCSGRARVLTLSEDERTRRMGGGASAAGCPDVVIVLPAEARVRGTMGNALTGEPVEGRFVTCSAAGMPVYMQSAARSGADGSFAIGALAPGEYMIEVAPDAGSGEGIGAAPVVVTVEPGGAAAVDFRLGPPAPLEISVVDEAGQRPLSGALVELKAFSGAMATTDAVGMARFAVAPGIYEVAKVHREGYETAEPRLRVEAGDAAAAPAVVALVALPAISGIAVDRSGRGVPGVKITVLPLILGDEPVTGPDGRFTVNYDPARWASAVPAVSVMARHEKAGLAGLLAISEATDELIVHLNVARGIALEVAGADGAPLELAAADATIIIDSDRRTVIDRTTLWTDSDGRCQWTTLPSGVDYVIGVRLPGYGARQVPVFLAAGEDAFEEVKVVLDRADRTISGVVKDPGGQPVARALVLARGQGQTAASGRTDSEGRFALGGLCEGEVSIEASVEATRLMGRATAQAGAAAVEVALAEGAPRAEAARPASLVGRPLPDMGPYGCGEEVTSARGGMVLVAVIDVNQRGSRRMGAALSQAAATLAADGIAVVGLDTSGESRDARDETLPQAGITFAVGAVAGDPAAVLASWGVGGLPWLILTDEGHCVRAEGFRLEELDATIEAVRTRTSSAAPGG